MKTTDLTFITNEQGANLKDRLAVLFNPSTKLFDCLVGYFYLSGFHLLYPYLENTEKIRILIGLKTDKKTFDLIEETEHQRELFSISHAEIKETIPEELRKEFENSQDTNNVENGVRKFLEWCKSGKLEIKVYPSRKIHAKLYIMTFAEKDRDIGRVITGSSNFSQSGLEGNLEFNVELKNPSDYKFASDKFNELWKDAVNVTSDYVDTIDNKSSFASFLPYELYLKFLYEYFTNELSQPENLDSTYLPQGFKKLKYQSDAVIGAKRPLEDYGGVFLSDVVGLGKTFMSALLAQELDGKTLVIAPPALLDENNPGSWKNVFREFGILAQYESIGKLDKILQRGVSQYKNVFVDESHRFRTETNDTYEKLAQICRGKRTVLVTATPLNNSPKDILSQIKLFQNGKNSTIPNIKNLELFFSRLENRLKGLDRQADREEYFRIVKENAKEIREKVLKHLMIRRTRNEISNYYAEDLAAQNLKFPEVANPTPVYYALDEREDEIFFRTMFRLAKEFNFARYKPLTYYTGEIKEGNLTGQRNLAVFMKILLVKRLESSFYAFRLSIERFTNYYKRFIEEYKKGFVYISKKNTAQIFELLEMEDDEEVEKLLNDGKAEKIEAELFSENFLPDLESDLQLLYQIRDEWETIGRDPKWETFRAKLEDDKILKENKLILFTESKETAEYLVNKFEEIGEKVVLFTGSSNQKKRDEVIQNFDAKAFQRKDDYRILVTTDTLAEGVNLHRSNVVINYDIPWNPTRMIQRVGRVNRVDTKFETVFTYNFFPTEQSNDLIKLKESAEAKIQAFIEMLGADAKLLTEGEEIKSHDLFERLFSKKTITGEDEGEESELSYLKVIREIREKQPDLFERIKRLPRKARSGKSSNQSSAGLLSYFRRGRIEKFFLAEEKGARVSELDFLEAVKFLECAPDESKAPINTAKFYELLDQNKTAFVYTTVEESHGETTVSGGKDNITKILRALRSTNVRRFQAFTDEQEDYIKRVIKLLDDGAIPKQTAKKIWENIKDEDQPLKIYDNLQRNISQSLFNQTYSAQNRGNEKPREVILSAYLTGK